MVEIEIMVGDALLWLRRLEPESVHTVVTSPPYWSLRDYGVPGQIGLEPTMDAHFGALVEVFREVRRVLRRDGTLWINYGDAYSTGTGRKERGHSHVEGGRPKLDKARSSAAPPRLDSGLPAKNLLGLPWRLALALQADGWILRSCPIWVKPNPIPEGASDRPARSYEHLFLFSREPRYFYDQFAVREDAVATHDDGSAQSRNLRDFWPIPTDGVRESHFATFPGELAARCILLSTSARGACKGCGAPWARIREPDTGGSKGAAWHDHSEDLRKGQRKRETRTFRRGATIGWEPTCECSPEVEPATVLDPFGGIGTTAMVAAANYRGAKLIEISEEYSEMARERLARDYPLVARTTVIRDESERDSDDE